MNKIKILSLLIAVTCLISCTVCIVSAEGNTVNITINTQADRKAISPYIYGVNAELMYTNVSAKAIRAGGNRYSAYNWETNASNAGSDWHHSSDGHLVRDLSDDMKEVPGATALNLAQVCKEKNHAYPLMTLQMAGYVAADMNGDVGESQTAPSNRWNEIRYAKGSDFSLKPDLDDGVVYMDEFVNYLVKKLGDSASKNGIKGYSLDNEPALWHNTHARVHPDKVTCREIVERSVELAGAVKNVDPNAEIFGPALYGFNAYTTLQGAPDWGEISSSNDYRWFIDYYLDEMKKAEEETGVRLFDVLDVHFYTEAKGECGERSCNHYDREGCVLARLNSIRTLWDESYREDSWIASSSSGQKFIPILPSINESIEKYHPGTKLAITEYNFHGGDDICGTIVEADALGVFAQNGVYFATLFSGSDNVAFTLAAIDLYTNYDGKGNGFGDTLVSCASDDIDRSTAYASIFGESSDVVTLVVTNKSFNDNTIANITLDGGAEYGYVKAYTIDAETADIIDISESADIALSGNKVTYNMAPESVSLLVIAKDERTAQSLTSSPVNVTPWVISGIAALAVIVAIGAVVGVRKHSAAKKL